MAYKLLAYETVAGSCELVQITPSSKIVSGNGSVTVTETTDPVTGQKTYDISDVSSTLTPLVATGHPIATHSGTDPVTINETITSVAVNGPAFDFTDEAGNVTTVSLCQMYQNAVDNGVII